MINEKLGLKKGFIEQMNELLGENEAQKYFDSLNERPVKSIRCNTLKISCDELKKRLENKGWKIKQPYKSAPEIFVIESNLDPGELGRSLEHQLGYYYVQELSSMMPVLALKPQPGDFVLDLCASPGSKTTQIASEMKNEGLLIANDVSLPRLKILASNLERCGVANEIITRRDGVYLCKKLEEEGFQFDKILVDAPCSGEGTIRSAPKTVKMWNPYGIVSLSKIQKRLVVSAFSVLKVGGEMVYSTCTHSPQENEETIDFLLKQFPGQIKVEKTILPLKTRPGVLNWRQAEYSKEVSNACRIYPHDGESEGFFITKLKRIK
ncbi:MAG TPA: RsmB/NOP family class I SAM-dependent RNA methyltransferase [Candidatus Pacearchaeota archaeon]|nr:RsmB/NOP family class I SAM-dependent RNA methyltransferase [Candidatus Pacearchaeota archaeon]